MHTKLSLPVCLIVLMISIAGCRTTPPSIDRELEAKIEEIISPKKARIGVAVAWNRRIIAAVNDDDCYPLMSVMKFHQALAVADTLSRIRIPLDTTLCIGREELLPDTWSPLRDRYPSGDVALSVRELLAYTLRQSDNNACDILFRRFGGPDRVDRCMRTLGCDRFAIRATEEEMHTRIACCYENWSSPADMALLLDKFIFGEPFAAEYKDFIIHAMIECNTGTDRLAAGLAGTGAVIGHKTGTGDRNERGERIGCNDAGFVLMPDGDLYTIAVFISDSAETDEENVRTIATVSETVYHHISDLKKK